MGIELLVGAIVSLLTQVGKKYVGDSEYVKIGLVVILSLLAGFIAVGSPEYWQRAVDVFVVAGGFYAFIIKRFEK